MTRSHATQDLSRPVSSHASRFQTLLLMAPQQGFLERLPHARRTSILDAWFRAIEAFDSIILTQYVHRPSGPSMPAGRPPLPEIHGTFEPSTTPAQVQPEIQQRLQAREALGARVQWLTHDSRSPFVSDLGERALRGLVQSRMPCWIAGMETDVFVIKGALDLIDQKVQVHLLEGGCASSKGPEAHAAALAMLGAIAPSSTLCL